MTDRRDHRWMRSLRERVDGTPMPVDLMAAVRPLNGCGVTINGPDGLFGLIIHNHECGLDATRRAWPDRARW